MNGTLKRRIVVVPNAQELATTAAQRLVDRIGQSPKPAAICLMGGSTPKTLYKLLAMPQWCGQIPWLDVHWFIGDERFVSADDPLNNMRMARQLFLDSCAPPQAIHAIDSSAASPEQAAQGYERELKDFQRRYRVGRPLFDLVLMGVGSDGHTASLFPDHHVPGYHGHEQKRWVVGVDQAGMPPFVARISLTLSCLAQTREMLFLASGTEKREILSRVFAGEDLPAGQAYADSGETTWILDEAASPKV